MNDDATIDLHCHVNGIARNLRVPPLARLLDILRLELGLTGTKEGCGEGECGACTVLLDGVAVNSCLIPAAQIDATTITTIEATAFRSEQTAFLDECGTQCGICTPGMIVMTHAWLARCARDGITPDADGARRALAGNLCRCTGYASIVRSALAAAQGPR